MKLAKIFMPFLIFFSFKVWAEFKVFDVDEDLNLNGPWYNKNKSDEENLKKLISALKKTEFGKKIISKASEKAALKGQTLYDVVAVGDGSLTDTTLIRRFQASNPLNVMYESRSKVYLNRHLKMVDAILDFAHELTHYTYREPFNPYDHRFTLKDFVKNTVEGRGGEVDAYIVECKVYFELFPGERSASSNCQKILDKGTRLISKDLAVIEFYKVGDHYENFKADIKKFSLSAKDIPEASEKDAVFISSAWGLPYPIAAVKEYSNIMDKVCKNDQNRLSLIQSKVERAPSSIPEKDIFKTMFEDFKIRCDKFTN